MATTQPGRNYTGVGGTEAHSYSATELLKALKRTPAPSTVHHVLETNRKFVELIWDGVVEKGEGEARKLQYDLFVYCVTHVRICWTDQQVPSQRKFSKQKNTEVGFIIGFSHIRDALSRRMTLSRNKNVFLWTADFLFTSTLQDYNTTGI